MSDNKTDLNGLFLKIVSFSSTFQNSKDIGEKAFLDGLRHAYAFLTQDNYQEYIDPLQIALKALDFKIQNFNQLR